MRVVRELLALGLAISLAACGSGGGAGGGGSGGGGGGGGGDGGSGMGTDGGGGRPRLAENRALCPLELPQRVYGYAPNAVSTLDHDEVWTSDHVYLVIGPFHVAAQLTIAAGTTVCFDYGPPGTESQPEPPPGLLRIEARGSIVVDGRADSHVRFVQATDDFHQYWEGISFGSGARTGDSSLRFVDVYNAGISAGGGALSTWNDATQAPLDFENVTFYSLQRTGLKNLTGGFTPASHIVIHNYAAETPVSDLFGYPALRVHVYGARTIGEGTLVVGDAVPAPVRYVQLDHAEGASLDQDVTLHRLSGGLKWRNVQNMKMSGTMASPAVLRLDPGVILAVNQGGYIEIGDGGESMADLVAVGTKQLPIVFTSDAFTRGETPKPGDWPGIRFSPGNFRLLLSRIDWATFEYGGGTGKDAIFNCNDLRSDISGEIVFTISSTGEDYFGMPITHSIFRESGGDGVRFRCNVGHSGGCLATDYTAPELANNFIGFTPTLPAENPLSCP